MLKQKMLENFTFYFK